MYQIMLVSGLQSEYKFPDLDIYHIPKFFIQKWVRPIKTASMRMFETSL